jgi:hypothetical protein
MSGTAPTALLLTADDGDGETFVLSDLADLQKPSMILRDLDGFPVALVRTDEFMEHHSVKLGDPVPAKGASA